MIGTVLKSWTFWGGVLMLCSAVYCVSAGQGELATGLFGAVLAAWGIRRRVQPFAPELPDKDFLSPPPNRWPSILPAIAVLTLLLLPATAMVQTPTPALKIAGDLKVLPYKLVRLAPEGDVTSAAVIWDVYPEEDIDAEEISGRLVFTAPPGVYRVKLRTIRGNKVETARATVVIETPPPPPAPTPGPTPPPKPDPPGPVTPAKLFLVVIEETADLATERGRLFTDAALTKRMKEKGHRWRILDKDVTGADGKPPDDAKPYLDRAKGKPFPQLFVVTDQGQLRFAGDLPRASGELLSLVQKLGG